MKLSNEGCVLERNTMQDHASQDAILTEPWSFRRPQRSRRPAENTPATYATTIAMSQRRSGTDAESNCRKRSKNVSLTRRRAGRQTAPCGCPALSCAATPQPRGGLQSKHGVKHSPRTEPSPDSFSISAKKLRVTHPPNAPQCPDARPTQPSCVGIAME
jgi:hypothetical protein